MRTSSTFLAMSLLSCVGCDSLQGGADAGPSATVADAAVPSPTASSVAPPTTASGPAKWPGFPSAQVVGSPGGPKAWAVVPVAWPDFATVKIARLDWTEARGDQQLFRFMSQETLVPNAATAPSKAHTGLAPGTPGARLSWSASARSRGRARGRGRFRARAAREPAGGLPEHASGGT
jgi:hypothetical protein